MIGSTIENYKVVSLLGEGGMGIVYRAFDLKLERYVALKILSAQATTNNIFKERFKREAKNQARLAHPNIVPVYGFTEPPGTLGIVMEYVEGDTLEKIIEKRGRLHLLESLYIIRQILAGISYAHKKGFIHRDIKPSNIIISTEGIVKIMDFGISKALNEGHGITKTGTKLGTILYMSPEQIRAQEPTAQSDIYSIGITLFEMLAGKTPFDEGTDFQIMENHLKKNPPKLSVTYDSIPGETDRIIGRALAKQLNKRYANCEEFLDDINHFIKTLDSQEKKKITKNVPVEPQRNVRKEKLWFYIFAILFFAVLSTLFIFFFNTAREFWKKPFRDSRENAFVQEIKEEQGIKFTPIPLNMNISLSSVVFMNDSVGIACGSNGVILKSNDAGYSWLALTDTTYGNMQKAAVVSSSKVFIVGDKGLILVSDDQGSHWRRIETSYNNSFFNISFADTNTGFIIGTDGIILKTTNGGNDWNEIPSFTTENLFGIYINSGNKNLFIVGWNGQLLKSTDLGANWNINKSVSQKYLRSINFLNDNFGFAVGGGGEILKTSDGGNSWNKINTNVYSGLMRVKFKNAFEGMILGGKGEILHTKDAGLTWKIIPAGIYFSLTDIAYNRDKVFISGYNGLLFNN